MSPVDQKLRFEEKSSEVSSDNKKWPLSIQLPHLTRRPVVEDLDDDERRRGLLLMRDFPRLAPLNEFILRGRALWTRTPPRSFPAPKALGGAGLVKSSRGGHTQPGWSNPAQGFDQPSAGRLPSAAGPLPVPPTPEAGPKAPPAPPAPFNPWSRLKGSILHCTECRCTPCTSAGLLASLSVDSAGDSDGASPVPGSADPPSPRPPSRPPRR